MAVGPPSLLVLLPNTELEKRIALIKRQISESDSDYDKEKLQERLAKLAGGVAVIRVGAATEVEMKEKKDRVDDAQHATKAAIEEGVLPGGGTAYIRALKPLNTLIETLSGDEKVGATIISKALKYPLRQIAENSGEEGSLIVQKVLSMNDNEGYDARENNFGNMYEKGILDPTKVVRSALQYASSVASLLLTTEVIITDENEEKAQTATAPAMDY